jgi:hypothetical protein
VTGTPRWPSVVVPGALAVAAAWSLLPFGAWWAGADLGYYTSAWQAWAWGTLLVACLAAMALVLTRGAAATLLVDGWRRFAASLSPGRFVALAAVVLAVAALLMGLVAFSGNPRNVDGFAQLFQARMFLAGRLWVPPPPAAELANFATLHMIVGPARWFSQYPPGQSLVLAMGLALGAWWLLNPLFVVALVVGTYRAARWCADETTARLAVVLLCLSPFVVAVSGSEMSHLPAAAIGMVAAAAAGSAASNPLRAAAVAGAALGVLAAFRPLDAVAAAVPVAVMLLLAAPPRRRFSALAAAAVAGALCTLPLLWYNAGTTGSWHELGYMYLWGPNHSLGFHPVPWGIPLTPTRSVGLTSLDLHQIDAYLFDAPFPVLVLVAIAFLAARRRVGTRDVVPIAGAGALLGLLFFYWHRDVFYGPRFLFTAVPWVVILAARGLVLLRRSGREVFPGVTSGHAGMFGFAVAMLVGLGAITPGRLAAYRRATPVFDLHPDRGARRAGIHQAVVVIPDGWGSRLIVRMWAAGVPVPRSTRLYAAIDACSLEQALDGAASHSDSTRRGWARLLSTLDSLAALRRPGLKAGTTMDPNLRLPADSGLAPECRAELARDSTGFLAFAPFLYLNRAGLDGDIVWARDLGPWNGPLFAHYHGRAFYRYAPRRPGEPPVFTRLESADATHALR